MSDKTKIPGSNPDYPGGEKPSPAAGPPDLQLHKASKDKAELVALLGNLEVMRKQLPVILEMQEMMARVKYNKFKQLMAAGFTEAQALQLCNNSDLI